MAPKPDKSFAKAATKLGLATAIAALWLSAVPITGAVADVQISAARAQALQQCNRLANHSCWPCWAMQDRYSWIWVLPQSCSGNRAAKRLHC